jgi:hypothetical protein
VFKLRQLSDDNITGLIKGIVEPFTSKGQTVNSSVVIVHKHYLGEFPVSAFAYVPVLFKCDGTYQMVLLYVTEEHYDYSVISLKILDAEDIKSKVLLFVSHLELAEEQKKDLAEGFYQEIQTTIVKSFSAVCLKEESLVQ